MPSIIDAVYRYYESWWRVTNDARPERVLQVQINKKNTARRSLQRQVCMSTDNHTRSNMYTYMYTFFLCSSMIGDQNTWKRMNWDVGRKLTFSACLKKVPMKTKMVIALWWGTVTPGAQTVRTEIYLTQYVLPCTDCQFFILQISIGFAKKPMSEWCVHLRNQEQEEIISKLTEESMETLLFPHLLLG